MNTPKYALLYNITTPDSWISRVVVFYTNKTKIDAEFERLLSSGQSPVLRQYNPHTDRKYLR